jgi:hypothetical protein
MRRYSGAIHCSIAYVYLNQSPTSASYFASAGDGVHVCAAPERVDLSAGREVGV